MLGVITDEEGRYVKAAILKMYQEKDTFEDSEIQTITYALTDEQGKFVVQNLDPDEKYVIEIYVEDQMVGIKNEAAAAETKELEEDHLSSETEAEQHKSLLNESIIISNLNQNLTGSQFKYSNKSNQELEIRLHSVKTCTWL